MEVVGPISMVAWLPLALSALTFVSTFVGGYIAWRSAGSLRYLFAFGAGTLLAIAFLDLLPEVIGSTEGDARLRAIALYVILGSFVLFHFVERYVLVHHHHEHAEDEDLADHAHDHEHAHGGLG